MFDSKKANCGAKIGDTTDVGKFSPQGDSPYGCVDMTGNVSEWVNDWYDENEYEKHEDGVKDPQGAQTGDYRVLRGGAWGDFISSVRSANRNWFNPTVANYIIGFRCARSLP